MSSFGLLGLGVQATNANKTALGVIGHNISNVNTPGYSRQVVNFSTQTEQRGVSVDSITRITDDFLTRQLWSDTSSFYRTDVFADMASELDNLLATDSTSVSTAIDNYFKALQNAVDDPTSLPNRELFVAEAEALARRFNDLNTVVMRQNDTINANLDSLSSQVSVLAGDIAELNGKIAGEVSAGREANELRDQRDQLVEQISELIDVRVVEQGRDEFSIFVSNGEPLVVGVNANQLVAIDGDPDPTKKGLAVQIAGNNVEITDRVEGGKLGGLLAYRTDVLDQSINELGRIAIAFAETMNNQHQAGIDLNGDLGGLLFSDVNSGSAMASRVSTNSNNSSVLSSGLVKIVDVSKLQASDYEITFNSSDDLVIERLSDGKIINLDDLTQVATSSDLDGQDNAYYSNFNDGEVQLVLDGVQINLDVTGRFIRGDRFLVQPVRQGASQFDTVISDGRQLALASPVRILTSADNTGTGVAEVNVTDPASTTFQATLGAMSPPVEVVFNNDSPTTYTVYDISDPLAPTPLSIGGTPLVAQAFTAGTPIVLDGYEITINNQPQPGDRFTFEYNTGGVSDNRNALKMSNLQLSDVLEGGSYQDIYGSLIERVGTETSVSVINRDASESVLKSTQESKSSLVGVNLDEEAAKLIQFQQAYQASAQLISTSQTLFDTLLNSVS
ncbi:flagellar hook-associated protein FlgK [Pontibacterium sp.]|uniref:flagellar hook-associated protein FlgK n=1 Tax=Pontibacterium sp. TaxID=2036026 RepID=UPI003518620C